MPLHARKLLHPLACAGTIAAALLLASCGGGGDSGSVISAFPVSSTLANVCTLAGQQKFVRSFMDETYFWYDEIPNVTAADFATVPGYFNALLVRTPDANGKPKDRFSAVLTSVSANVLQSVAGDSLLGAGVPAKLLAAAGKSVPLNTVVASPNGRMSATSCSTTTTQARRTS